MPERGTPTNRERGNRCGRLSQAHLLKAKFKNNCTTLPPDLPTAVNLLWTAPGTSRRSRAKAKAASRFRFKTNAEGESCKSVKSVRSSKKTRTVSMRARKKTKKKQVKS